jgi:hypothetical protein
MIEPNIYVKFREGAQVEYTDTGNIVEAPRRVTAYSVEELQDPPQRFDDQYTWVVVNEESDKETIAKQKDILGKKDLTEIDIE